MSESGTGLLIKYLTEHVGEEIPLQTLNDLCGSAGLHHWDRVIRNLKQQQGYDISNKKGEWYKLNSLERKAVKGKREYINKKLRFLVLERDNYTCQACGATPADGIKLVMDHVIPVDWGGTTDFDNLRALCTDCNEGKKAWVNGEDTETMREVCVQTNTAERLRVYFQHHPNEKIDVDKLAVVAKTREWTRQLRFIRAKYNMNIQPLRRSKKENRKKDAYIYLKED